MTSIIKRITGIIIYATLKNLNLRFLLPKKYSSFIEELRTYALVLQGSDIRPGTLVRNGVFVAYPSNLVLGENITIGPYSKFFNYVKVTIGDETEIGASLHVQTNDHEWSDKTRPLGKQGSCLKEVSIGCGVFIGANVTILKGVSISDLCIVAAGSVVVNDLESGFIYAGIPAKKISEIS
jgi:acetyltransferase-like isoleucine patch superfamily enzyme